MKYWMIGLVLLSGCGVSQKQLKETSSLLGEGITYINAGRCQELKYYFQAVKNEVDSQIKK